MNIKQINKHLARNGFKITRGSPTAAHRHVVNDWHLVGNEWRLCGSRSSNDLRYLMRCYRSLARYGWL
jgi:hypothetical protein